MKNIIRYFRWTFILAVFITACGGGGSGSSGNGSISYTGLTTQAHLSAANASAIFSLVWNGGNSLGTISPKAVTAKVVPGGGSNTDRFIILARRLGEVCLKNSIFGPGVAKTAASMVPINESRPGAVSGTLTMSGSIDDATGRGEISVTFTNFNDGDGYTHNGAATLQVNAVDMSTGVLTDWTMSCSLWNIKSATSDVSISGSMRMQNIAAYPLGTLTVNMDGRDNLGKETFRYENFEVRSGYDSRFTPMLMTETYSGRAYVGRFGYVDISTASPCVYSDPEADHPVSGGPIILAGGGNSRAAITPFTFGIKIEVDDNGDGGTDSTSRYLWDNLAGAALTTISVTPTAPTVPAGLTQHFMATGTFSDNSSRDLTNLVTWTSSDTYVAMISSREGTYSSCTDLGCAYGQSIGASTITASLLDLSGTAAMTVGPAALLSIEVHTADVRQNPTIAMGMTQQFEAFGTFSNNSREYVTGSVTWSSSDNSVATISNMAGSKGMASSLASGTTAITATSGAVSGSTTLSVSAWTLRNAATTSDLNRVMWSGTQFVAAGADGTILTSSDGKAFVQRPTGTFSALYDVAWSGGSFVATGANGTILSSPDGTAWTAQVSGTLNSLYGVVWTGNRFVAVGASGTILASTDGAAWAPQTSGTASTLHGVAWSGSRLVAVGANGTVLTSPDGTAWTLQTSGTLNNLGRVTWSGQQFAAVSGAPYDYSLTEYPIHTSPDGITWTNRGVAPGLIWRSSDIAWCGMQYVATGGDGYIFTSGNGAEWAPWVSGTRSFLSAVACSGTRYVVAGSGGIILSLPQ